MWKVRSQTQGAAQLEYWQLFLPVTAWTRDDPSLGATGNYPGCTAFLAGTDIWETWRQKDVLIFFRLRGGD